MKLNRLTGDFAKNGENAISGWATFESGNDSVLLDIYVNDLLLTKVWANRKFTDKGNCSFSFSFSDDLIEHFPINSSVKVFSQDGQELDSIEEVIFSGNAESLDVLQEKISEDYFISKWGTIREKINKSASALFPELYTKLNDTFFDLTGYNLQISYGTLLGYVREGDFIKHDDDFDLTYVSLMKTLPSAIGEMLEIMDKLKSNGYGVSSNNGGQFFVSVSNDDGEFVVFDIFLAWCDEFYNQYFMLTQQIEPSHVLPEMAVKFKEVDVFIPKNPEIILAGIYGDTWDVPDPYFNWSGQTTAAQKLQEDAVNEYEKQLSLRSSWKKTSKCFWCCKYNLRYVDIRSDGVPIYECTDCELRMIGLKPENIEELYTSEYFQKCDDEAKIGYANYFSSPSIALAGKLGFVEIIQENDQRKILDLGCADGSLVELFHEYGWQAYGLDISDDSILIGVKKNLNLSQSNLKQLTFEDDEYPNICAFDLIEHLENPRETLDEIARVLSDDGIFYFTTLCIKKDVINEYWYQTSLEHTIYYDLEVLQKMMREIFSDVILNEVVINGVTELVGIATNSKFSTKTRDTMELLSRDQYVYSNPETALHYLSYYCQMSKFEIASRILEDIPADNYQIWFTGKSLIYYFQGFFEKLKLYVEKNINSISIDNFFIWRGYAFAVNFMADAKYLRLQDRIQDLKNESLIFKKENKVLEGEGEDTRRDCQKMKEECEDVKVKLSKHKDYSTALEHKLYKSERQVYIMEQSSFWKMRNRYLSLKILPVRKWKNVKKFFSNSPNRIIAFGREHFPENVKNKVRFLLPRKYQCKVVQDKSIWEGPLVSIIVPFYNKSKTIIDTMDSLSTQTFVNFEVLIVNDGSDPGERRRIECFQDNKIRIIDQENYGVAIARNNGLKSAKGKYVLFLDSDDLIQPTYLEKVLIILESNPGIDFVYTGITFFGKKHAQFKGMKFDKSSLETNNYLPTAAVIKRQAALDVGGYKSGIGYEDWEFWLTLVENGCKGKLLPEALFMYRFETEGSKYHDDLKEHDHHIETIRNLHPEYSEKIKVTPNSLPLKLVSGQLYRNLDKSSYTKSDSSHVLVLLPWMTFGGAEHVVLNFVAQLKDRYEFSFMTSLKSNHEWESKFSVLSKRVYHLANLFENESQYYEFIKYYINSNGVDVVHIVHNSSFFRFLDQLKKDFPNIKVICTIFNTIAHFDKALENGSNIDIYTTDNSKVREVFDVQLELDKRMEVICNGIDNQKFYAPTAKKRVKARRNLGIRSDQKSIFYMGRLSEEKSPDVFIEAAIGVLEKNKDCIFFLVGDGPMRASLEKEYENFIQKGQIIFLGYQEEMLPFWFAADIFVLCSKTEGFPLTIVEAMATRTLVVASNVGGVSDAINNCENGYLINSINPENLKLKIESILSSPDESVRLINNAESDFKEKFTIEVMGDKFNDVYSRVL